MFLEAKWYYNDIVAKSDVFHADYKSKAIEVRSKDGKLELRVLRYLSSQMRQEIIDRAKDAVRGLTQLKENGHRVGALKFNSRVRSIPLKQFGFTYRISLGRVKVQNIRQQMRVRGLNQIPEGAEFANATLEQKNGDYFIHVTTYQLPVECTLSNKAIGIDAGVNHQLTLSNGLQIDENVAITKKVGRLQRELSRKKLLGKNWFKTKKKLNMEYERLSNQRIDIRHKIVSKLISKYDSIAVHDDNIVGWKRMWGTRVTASAIGGIMSDLKTRPHTPVVVGRFEPTTRKCSDCGALKEISLHERIYQCADCGLCIDRDLNAAVNVWKAVPVERREFTPVDTKAATKLMGYFNGIPNVSASLVEDAGSRLLATEAFGYSRR